MIKSSISILTIVLLFLSFSSFGQKFEKGMYKYGVVSIENDSENQLDTAIISYMKRSVEKKMSATFYFSKERMVVEKASFYGMKSRGVYDLETDRMFDFREDSNEKYFFVRSLEESIENRDRKEILGLKDFEEGVVLEEKIFGLTCIEYKPKDQDKIGSIIVTRDFLMPAEFQLSPFSEEMGTIVQFRVKNNGVTIVMGMTNFSALIDDENVFSIDTTGFVDKTEEYKR